NTAERLYPDRLQSMRGYIKVIGHTPLAFDPISKNDILQLAIKTIVPRMIDTPQRLLMIAVFKYDERTLVCAAIDHCIDFSLLVPRNDDRGVTDPAGTDVSTIRHLEFKAQIVPDRPSENAFLLSGIDPGVGENLERHSRFALARPWQRGRIRLMRNSGVHGFPLNTK